MSCPCEEYSCLEALFSPCNTGVELAVEANETATWTANIEFNGVWTRFSFGVSDGQNIIIPTQFLNERYTHEFRLYNSSGVLVGCYWLKAAFMGSAGSYSPVTPGAGGYLIFNVTVGVEGAVVTDSRFELGDVLIVVSNDNSYNTEDFTQSGDEVTLTNGATFTANQIVTITLELD